MFNIFLGIMLFQFGGLILPGPDFAIVFRHGIIKGKRDGLLCAAGVALGVMINLLLTYFIGTTLYSKYHSLYLCFISLGVLFLYYISISLIRNFFALRNKQNSDIEATTEHTFKGNSFINGLLTNLSNVKAVVFFSILLPLVNKLDFKYTLFTWFGMGLMAWGWFSCVVFLFGHAKIRHAFLAKIHIIELIIGSAIFIFASIIFYESVLSYFIK